MARMQLCRFLEISINSSIVANHFPDALVQVRIFRLYVQAVHKADLRFGDPPRVAGRKLMLMMELIAMTMRHDAAKVV